MTLIQQFQRWLAFKAAMWRWWQATPWIFDPRWGEGDQRRKNLDIAEERHDAWKPDCGDFGLSHRYVGGEEHCRRCYRRIGTE